MCRSETYTQNKFYGETTLYDLGQDNSQRLCYITAFVVDLRMTAGGLTVESPSDAWTTHAGAVYQTGSVSNQRWMFEIKK